jgi:hypothetical protein
MRAIKIPRLTVPDFWLAENSLVTDYLRDQIRQGVVHSLGQTTHGRPVQVVEYAVPDPAATILIIGGVHGHEPGTVAAAMNLLHLQEQGEDLAGERHPQLCEQLARTHLYVAPMLNPDGRAVCPVSFYAGGLDTCVAYASGLQLDGRLVPYNADADKPCYYFDPAQALFVGGQFNGAGWASNRRLSVEKSEAVEVQQLVDFVRGRGIEGCFDLHACGYNFAFQARWHPAPYWEVMRVWQQRAETLFQAKGRSLRPLYGDGETPAKPSYLTNAAFFLHQVQTGFFTYEGRQGHLGLLDSWPLPTEWEIIDDYLTAIEVFLSVAGDGLCARANREHFGG